MLVFFGGGLVLGFVSLLGLFDFVLLLRLWFVVLRLGAGSFWLCVAISYLGLCVATGSFWALC